MAQSSSRSRVRTALLFVVAATLVALGGAWLVLHQAEALAGRALSIVFGPGESAHRSIALDRDGHVVVEDLVFRPGGGQNAVRAERVRVETPGWRWFLRNGLDPGLRHARLDRLRLSLSGVRLDDAAALPLMDLRVFGGVSASPWAAEGCLQAVHWTAEKLAEAGLEPGGTSLQFDYRAQAGDLLATTTLETYGVSRVKWVRIGTVPGGQANMLLLTADSGLTRSEHWEVQDQGFVAARNRYCASKDEVDPRRFVDRHVESVARRLATLGLEVDADTWDRYRRFALAGGKLSVSVAYPRPMTTAALLQLRQSAAWSETSATIDRNGDSSVLRWHRIARPTMAETQVETLADAPAASAATQATPEEAGPVSESAPRNAVAGPATTSRGPPPAIPPLTHFVKPTPVSAGRAATVSAARVVPTRRGAPEPKALGWNELRTLRGRTIEIWTMHSPPRPVQILEVSDDSLRVSYRIRNNGEATFSIKREAILRAVLES